SGSKEGEIRVVSFGPTGLGSSLHHYSVGPGVTGTWLTSDGLVTIGFEDGRLELRHSDGSLIKSRKLIPQYKPRSQVLYGTTRPISNAVRGSVHCAAAGTLMVFLENADNFELELPTLDLKKEWHEQRDFNIGSSSPSDGSFVVVGERQGVLRVYRN